MRSTPTVFCTILALLACAAGVAESAAPGPAETPLVHRVTFAPGDLLITPAGGAAGASGAVSVSLRGVPVSPAGLGEPALPQVPLTLVIPADRTVVGVRAIVEGEQVLDGRYTLAATVELTPAGERSLPVAADWRQGPLAQAAGEGYLRGFKLASVALQPVRWDPGSGRLSLVTSVRLELDLAPATDEPLPRARETATVAEAVSRLVETVVANPEALAPGWRGGGGIVQTDDPGVVPTARPTADGSAVDYVIVTVDSLAAAFQAFADWKSSLGEQAVVRTISWITANYPGGADRAETIRTFLRDAYQNWGTLYVLLGGDAPLVPYRAGHTSYYTMEDIPTDLYYQCLDGNWNADGDSLYGEGASDDFLSPRDAADLYPEVFVGRVPANTVADVQTWIAKTRHFAEAASADFATKALFASEVLFPSNWEPGDAVAIDGATLTEQAVQLLPPTMTAVRLYQRDTAFPGALPETRQATLDSLNSGYMLWEHMGHGYRNTLSVGNGSITNPDVDALTNADRQGVVYSVNCNSASFEYTSISERFLFNTHGGAVAYVGATRYDFPATVGPYQTEFFRLVFRDTALYTLGAAASLSKVGFVPFSRIDNTNRWTQFSITLLGDPSLALYWRAPRALSVALPPLAVGQDGVTATVTAGGQPVPRARVTLWKADDAAHATGLTDAAGHVTLPFRALSPGAVSVGAAAPGDLASVTTATVAATGAAYVAAESVGVLDAPGDGNGDGVANPGETPRLVAALRNRGGAAATGVTAAFTTGDWHVQVIDSVATVGTIGAGQSAGAQFRVAVSGDAPDDRIVRGVVTVRDGAGHVWQGPAAFGIASPAIVLVGRAIRDTVGLGDGDGIAEAGETVAYRPILQNTGSGAAHGLVVHLASADATTQMIDSTQAFAGDLGAHASGMADDWITFLTLANGSHRFIGWITSTSSTGTREIRRLALDLEAPAAPRNAHAFGSATDIALVWTASPESDVQGYDVYRSAVSGGPYAKVNAYVDARTAYYRDEGLPPFSRFYYEIAAIDSSGNVGPLSSEVSSTTNPPLHAGWPIDAARSMSSSATVANVDASVDGSLEIAAGADKLYVLRPDGGELLDGDGSAQTIGPFAPVGIYVAASPAVADLDDDGVPDVVMASYNAGALPTDSTTVWVLDGVTGLTRAGWPHAIPKFGWSSPALGDIDGDGTDEIVMGCSDGWIYAWHASGTGVLAADPSVPGRFYNTGALFLYGSPALADVDHDGRVEIVVGTAVGGGNPGRLLVLNGDGSLVAGFPYTSAGMGAVQSSPAVAQLFTSGPHVGQYQILFGSDDNTFRCVNEDGTQLWMRYLTQATYSRPPSPAIGDVDGDGALDVVTASTSGRVYAMRGTDGADLTGWPVVYGIGTQYVSECSPILADLDGDGHVDVLVGAEDGRLYGFRHDGTPAPGFPIALPGEVRGSPAVWDVDGDGYAEIALAGWDQSLYLWDLPAAFDPATSAPWPMFHHDARHTGLVGEPFLSSPSTATGVAAPPFAFAISPSAPSPWTAATRIGFVVPGVAGGAVVPVRLRVYDAAGRLVATLVDGPLTPGRHAATWEGRTARGTRATRGVYLYRLEAPGAVLSGRTVRLD